MHSVKHALSEISKLIHPVSTEIIPLAKAHNRVLAKPVIATRSQPPFFASAMDGYAINAGKLKVGSRYKIIGQSYAGNAFTDAIGLNDTVRIFTGAPVPKGATKIIIQEDVIASNHEITIQENYDPAIYIRDQGQDFKVGFEIEKDTQITVAMVGLLASMGIDEITVYRKPKISIVMTGDELVQPGDTPQDDQIFASNGYALQALLNKNGAEATLLPIAKDALSDLTKTLEMALNADLILTIGGASVGDHDLVQKAANKIGFDRSFYKISMRPGKPLMAGMLKSIPIIGLPGNPVSAMICTYIFVLPALSSMLGLGFSSLKTTKAILDAPLPKNGARTHYMRGIYKLTDGQVVCTGFKRQDSALNTVLNQANCLIIRDINVKAAQIGDLVNIIII